MAYADRQMGSGRIIAIIIVALIHAVLGYAFVTGLAYNVVKQAAEDLNVFDVEEEPPPPEEEPPPPPPDQPIEPPPVVSPPPIVRTNIQPPPPIQNTQVIRPPVPPTRIIVPPAPPAAAPAPPPPPSKPAQRAKLRGGAPSNADYPPSAERNEEEGVTSVSLTIGPDGRVASCSVTKSSGSSTLDSATCSIFQRRTRFTPATDPTGAKVGDRLSQSVRWQIER